MALTTTSINADSIVDGEGEAGAFAILQWCRDPES